MSAKLILDEGLANFKQPIRNDGAVIHVVQYEHGGIPHEPYLTMDIDKALNHFEELAISQGFRKIHSGEDLKRYLTLYDELLDGKLDVNFPRFNSDHTIRWWELELT